MSTPALSSIDLSVIPAATPALSSIDLSGAGPSPSDPAGVIQEELGFLPQISAAFVVAGQVDSALDFSAQLAAISGSGATISAALGFEVSISAESAPFFGQISATLEFTPRITGFQDWAFVLTELEIQEIYTLTITGAADGLPDIQVPMSTWQATHQAAPRQNYLQASIPGGDNWIDELQARQNGELVISKGFRFPDGTVRTEEILRSDFGDLRYDRGPGSYTLTVSGYQPGRPEQTGRRTLSGVRSISMTGGRRRARCAIDLFLQPGMTVAGGGLEFVADYINYYVSEADKFCEVSER